MDKYILANFGAGWVTTYEFAYAMELHGRDALVLNNGANASPTGLIHMLEWRYYPGIVIAEMSQYGKMETTTAESWNLVTVFVRGNAPIEDKTFWTRWFRKRTNVSMAYMYDYQFAAMYERAKELEKAITDPELLSLLAERF
jgi:hypothetical protein